MGTHPSLSKYGNGDERIEKFGEIDLGSASTSKTFCFVIWLWLYYLTSPNLNLSVCKINKIIPTSNIVLGLPKIMYI